MSAGRLRVQVPSGPPFSKSYRKADSQGFGIAFLRSSVSINRSEFSVRSVAANTLGLGPRDRRCNSCRADHFQIAAVVEHIRHPPSKRNDAGGNPAGSTRFKLPGGVKVARRFVKPHGVGASPTLAANFWKAGRYKLAALVSKTRSARHRGRSITDAFRQFSSTRQNHETPHKYFLVQALEQSQIQAK